jgi:hypothetical protein
MDPMSILSGLLRIPPETSDRIRALLTPENFIMIKDAVVSSYETVTLNTEQLVTLETKIDTLTAEVKRLNRMLSERGE